MTERLDVIGCDADDAPLLNHWLSSPLPISPWQAWTLLCLVLHRDRQQFVADTVVGRLDGSLEALANAGALVHPERPQQGVVPGDDEWEYYFHGCGCCLTHRQTGEAIDVDFYDSSSDWTDPFFLVGYLDSLKEPGFVEERVKSLHPHTQTVHLAIRELRVAGLLESYNESGIVRLGFPHEQISDSLNMIKGRWNNVGVKCSVASALGDWGLLSSLIDGEEATAIRRLHHESLAKRSSTLVANFNAGVDQADSLRALSDIGGPHLSKVLKQSLAGPPSGTVSAALEVISGLNDNWIDDVERLMNRIDGNGAIPQPYIWYSCAEYLLCRGRPANIRQELCRISSNCLGDVALLSLEYFPNLAIETFRRALRSPIPCNRITAAAALAIVDQPWSRLELAMVLDESHDQTMTSECRAALMTTHSEDAHDKVHEWESQHPHKPEEGPFISMTEMSLRMSDGRINYEMEKLHDRVLPLRETVVTIS